MPRRKFVLLAACALAASACATSSSTAPPEASTDPNALNLVVLGDSIAIPEIGCGSCTGFDAQYAAHIEGQTGRPVKVDNLARSTEKIAGFLERLQNDVTIAAAVADADVVVISIGFNDRPPWPPSAPCHAQESAEEVDRWQAILALTPDCITATIESYAPSLVSAYARVEELAAGRQQVRITLGVYNNWIGSPGSDAVLPPADLARAIATTVSIYDQWNAQDCELAAAHGFVCADIYHAFNGPDGKEPVGDLLAKDYVHPSQRGIDVIADRLEAVELPASF